MTVRVLYPKEFFHDGRGPELLSVHLATRSAHLVAIDFLPPDADGSPSSVRHLQFAHAQSFMFTPEEVENYGASEVDWGRTAGGALVSLGRSEWLSSFDQRHLGRCEHIRAMFYDYLLDVICEGVHVVPGAYADGR